MCRSEEQKLQCYACGMPKVTPENDLPGSYGPDSGKKMYNHSCDEMRDSMVDGEVRVLLLWLPHLLHDSCCLLFIITPGD